MPVEVKSAARNRKKAASVLSRLEQRRPPVRFVPRFDSMDELVSCILSQHAADIVTFPTFYALKAECPQWKEVASLELVQLAAMIRGAGLANQKAKSILSCLNIIKQTFGQYSLEELRDWPLDQALAFLESLPGVGPKTASIVMCFSFGRHSPPVDTHVHRVGIRLGLLPKDISANQAHVFLRHTVPEGFAFRFHVALIEHGRAVCTARAPACQLCDLNSQCPKIGLKGPKQIV